MSKPTLIYYTILEYQHENMERLKKHFNVLELPSPANDHSEVLANADVILAPLGYYCGKEKIDAARKVKVIGSNTTGHPHIDVDYARSKGIKIVTLKDHRKFLETITPTAELTWGLIIALTRNIIPASKSVLDGNWDRRPFGGQKMLSSMRLGVVGLGRLGRMVVRYALTFGMDVSCYDPFVSSGYPGLEKEESLQDLVAKCDIVTVHVPHEPETEGLFNARIFSCFKKGAFFINTSRGELVDHKAFLQSLEDGTLAGAALDVFEDEFRPGFQNCLRKHPLWLYAKSHDNLILTPHIGGSTFDAWAKTEEYTIRTILKTLAEEAVSGQSVSIIDNAVWAFIPARGGSKSIPLKNMVDLNGRPLIDYVIRAGQASKEISRIICSSDHDEILEYCKNSGIDVQVRPGELAGDNISTVDVIMYFLTSVHKEEKRVPEYLVLLEPTSPFVQPQQINAIINLLRSDPSADSAETLTEVEHNSHAYNQRMYSDRGINLVFPKERKRCYNKQLKPKFFIHGNVWAMRVKSLLEKKDIFGDKSIPLVLPRIYCMDVDGPEDLAVAKSLIESGLVKISD
jgi:D-3-phosphoglycerate dehydrogenase